jgi:hypothetical protein
VAELTVVVVPRAVRQLIGPWRAEEEVERRLAALPD